MPLCFMGIKKNYLDVPTASTKASATARPPWSSRCHLADSLWFGPMVAHFFVEFDQYKSICIYVVSLCV